MTCRSRFAGTPTRVTRSGYRKWYQRTLQVVQSSPLVASPPHQQTSTLLHCSYAHVNEELLRATARKLGVTLTGKLSPCIGCSMAKGLPKAIHKTTSTRASKKLGRMFVDLCSPKHVLAAGSKRYTMIVRDDFTRFTWLKFLGNKLDAADPFKEFHADTNTDGNVEIIRSDGGGVSGVVNSCLIRLSTHTWLNRPRTSPPPSDLTISTSPSV